MEKNSDNHYKTVDNSVFIEIMYCLTDEAAMYILEKLDISHREAYETENVKPLDDFTKFLLENNETLNSVFYCFSTSGTSTISFACMETDKEDTLLVFEIDVPVKKCTVIPAPKTHGFNGRIDRVEFPISHNSIEELREYAGAYHNEARNNIPFPGVGNPSKASPKELLAQRYFADTAMSTIDDMMDIIADEQGNADEIYRFRDYYQDEYPNCIITTDGKKISLTFCCLTEDGEIDGQADFCIIDPKGKKLTLIPSNGDKLSFKLSSKCIDQIQSLSSCWKGEHFGNPIPFPETVKNKSKSYSANDNEIDDRDVVADEIEYRDAGSYVVIKKDAELDIRSDIELIIDQIRETPSTNQITTQNAGMLFTMWFNNSAIADLLDACRSLCGFNEHEKQVFNSFVSHISQYTSLSMVFYEGNIRIDCIRQKGKKNEFQVLGVSFYGREFGVSINADKATFSRCDVPAAFKTYIKQLQSQFKEAKNNKKRKQ